MLRALCLDLMDTLVRDPYPEAVRAATGLELEAVRAVKDPDAWPDFEVGAIDERAFAQRFFLGSPEHTFDIEAFHRARWDGYAYLPGMADLLDDAAGVVERHVASNYPVWVEEVADRLGLRERTEGVWSSHHFGVRKPDRAFYERLLEAIGREPHACLFVDDRTDNCAAAEAAGMRAHHFTGADGLRERLRAEGVPLRSGARRA